MRTVARSSCACIPSWRGTSRVTARKDSSGWRARSTGRSRFSRTTRTVKATRSGCAAVRRSDALMGRARPSRISRAKLLDDLKLAARRGDRTALSLALDQMRTLALSPRYWEKYLVLLSNPLARLVDLLVIKQGDRIAQHKGRRVPTAVRKPRTAKRPPRRAPRRRPSRVTEQPSLFPDLEP